MENNNTIDESFQKPETNFTTEEIEKIKTDLGYYNEFSGPNPGKKIEYIFSQAFMENADEIQKIGENENQFLVNVINYTNPQNLMTSMLHDTKDINRNNLGEISGIKYTKGKNGNNYYSINGKRVSSYKAKEIMLKYVDKGEIVQGIIKQIITKDIEFVRTIGTENVLNSSIGDYFNKPEEDFSSEELDKIRNIGDYAQSNSIGEDLEQILFPMYKNTQIVKLGENDNQYLIALLNDKPIKDGNTERSVSKYVVPKDFSELKLYGKEEKFEIKRD